MGFKSNLSKSPKVINNFAKMFTNSAVVTALVVLVIIVVFAGLFVNMRRNVEGFVESFNGPATTSLPTSYQSPLLDKDANKYIELAFTNATTTPISIKTAIYAKKPNYYVIGAKDTQTIRVCKSNSCYINIHKYKSSKTAIASVKNFGTFITKVPYKIVKSGNNYTYTGPLSAPSSVLSSVSSSNITSY